jgi:hypothetical protein
VNYAIQVIPHDLQEYNTMGNWREFPASKKALVNGPLMLIEVDDLGDWRKELVVAIHEMVEAALCKHRGIPESVVSDFDKSHLDSPQPGDEPDAPYRREHEFATDIERLIARELDVDPQSY